MLRGTAINELTLTFSRSAGNMAGVEILKELIGKRASCRQGVSAVISDALFTV